MVIDWIECWSCGGVGLLAGCFEDCCSDADCDPEDAELCCDPRDCDVCHGRGGWDADEAVPASSTVAEHVGNSK